MFAVAELGEPILDHLDGRRFVFLTVHSTHRVPGRLVNEASMEAMTARPAGVAANEEHPGFGLFIRRSGQLNNGGIQDGTRTYLILNAETGRAFAWMTNYEGVPSNFDFLMTSIILGLLDG